MDNIMGNNRDFLQPLLEAMNKRMDDLGKQFDDSIKDVKEDIKEVKREVADLQKTPIKVGPKFTLTPNVIYLIALAFVLTLVIVASILHIDVSSISLGGLTK